MLQSVTAEIPLYLAKKLARVCTRSGCDAEAGEDSGECPLHHEESKARKRHSAKLRRALRRKKRQCRDCGRKSKRLRCPRCYRKSRGVAKPTEGVDKPAGNWRPDYDPETGAEWQRYRGKGRRGRLTTEQQLDEDKRDGRIAIEQIEKFMRECDVLKHPDVLALPRIQRDALRRQAGALLAHAVRFLDDLVDRFT